MRSEVAQQLIDLNRQFYQNAASAFSASRGRVQPGVRRVLAQLPAATRVLDLGCGNGNLAAELAQRGHTGNYVGVDSSSELLQEAEKHVEKSGSLEVSFLEADLTGALPELGAPFDWVFLLAALHHIPGQELRISLLQQVRGLLTQGGFETRPYTGRLVLSNWQFLNSERLRGRIQPWERAGLSDADVDPGDYLLDWRSGAQSLRYVHHFNAEELEGLAAECGFTVTNSFLSDGEGGKLGLYQVWQKGTSKPRVRRRKWITQPLSSNSCLSPEPSVRWNVRVNVLGEDRDSAAIPGRSSPQ